MDNFIEKYKIYIGLILTLAIIIGGVLLLWQKDIVADFSQKLKTQKQIELENYQKENEDLKKQITQLEEKIKSLESQETSATSQVDSEEAEGEKININEADLSELDKLPGIGPARAQDIINYREANEGFDTIEEIKNIKGIGDATYAKMKNMITVD